MTLLRLDLNDPKQCAEWDLYVKQHGPAGLNSQTCYLKAINKGLGHANISLFSTDEKGVINGALPLVLTKSILFGTFTTSLPFFNYGGIFADHEDVETRLVDEAFKQSRQLGASSVQLRESRELTSVMSRYPSAHCLTHKVHMRLDLPGAGQPIGYGNAKQRAKLKSQAFLLERKAGDENRTVRIEYGHLSLLDDFYSVFSRHMRDLGTPVYSKTWFKSMLEQLGQAATLTVLYLDNKPISTAFLITHESYMNIPWASSLKRYNNYSANTYLYWQIIEHAQGKGITVLDFGRSTDGEGTYKFKAQWGAKPYPCYWLNKPLNSAGAVDNLSPANPKFSLAISIWQRLPVWLTRLIGPSIVKSIP